ncbi:MAG TPA: hypothetical protein VFD01_12575 [Candidatus Dormibacteraeota bacterium]|jgi:hypothetical protein|nr:hypothetical protein [Candidatus Dormibacteraeota bacterium]
MNALRSADRPQRPRAPFPRPPLRPLALVALPLGLLLWLGLVLRPALWPGGGPVLTLRQAAYTLGVDTEGRALLASPSGVVYTTLPLEVVGQGAGPVPGRVVLRREPGGDRVVVYRVDWAGNPVEEATLVAFPHFFTVTFTASARALGNAASPLFFSTGDRGIDLSTIRAGWSPLERTSDPWPAVTTVGRVPLAPAPLDLELEGEAGWFGLGLVQVPDADTLALDADGSVEVDYPLGLLRRLPDQGAGGMWEGRLRFPSFVISFGRDPLRALAAYRRALVTLGTAPASPVPASTPAWWRQPIVDTWGEQMAEGVERDSPAYTAQWVRRFVTEARQRLGLSSFTVVIDSYWQEAIGDPDPDPVRFGGEDGMRQLIDWLHAQGLRVMLWWPLWDYHLSDVPPPADQVERAVPAAAVDPTSPAFPAATAATMARLLGSGPGELDADGLKLDWTYDIPVHLARPALGWGAAALHRYLEVLHAAAHRVRPDALIESSAAAPQFAGVTDAVRLYDAWRESSWDRRAAVVSVADPGLPIDGDGWAASPLDIVPHTVSSAVYGIPAFYFVSRWADGRPIPDQLLRLLGRVAALAALKGEGTATPLPDGTWRYDAGGTTTVQSLADNQALVLWRREGCGAARCGTLLSARSGELAVPVPVPGRVTAVGPGERLDLGRTEAGVVQVRLRAGVPYLLQVS